MNRLSAKLSAVGRVSGALGPGSIILNDYVLTISEIEGGHRLTVSRGSDVQTMDVLDGVGGSGGAVYSVNGRTGRVVLSAADVGAIGTDALGASLKMVDGLLEVNTAEAVEKDNTLPVTSAAVHAEVGNINALLETI